ncbi:MAG: hypothetical protein ACYC6Q_00920 [Syntrophales bacterium]
MARARGTGKTESDYQVAGKKGGRETDVLKERHQERKENIATNG